MKRIAIAVLGLLLAGGVTNRVSANGEEPDLKGSIKVAKGTSETALPAMAKVAFEDAVKTALKKVPGKVLKGELEGDEGYLIYSVDIVGADKVLTCVEIDAGTGAILAVEVEKDEPKKENGGKKDEDEGEDEDED